MAIATLALTAAPASAIPLLGIGADVGAAAHFTNVGTALDLNADVNVMGPSIGLRYWIPFGSTAATYGQLGISTNVSPVPMLNISPGIAGCLIGSAPGGMVTLNARFEPILLPAAIEGMVGAGYCNGGMLLPYNVDVKLSLIPFTSIKAGWRGWSGAAFTASGPEVGLEIGL